MKYQVINWEKYKSIKNLTIDKNIQKKTLFPSLPNFKFFFVSLKLIEKDLLPLNMLCRIKEFYWIADYDIKIYLKVK